MRGMKRFMKFKLKEDYESKIQQYDIYNFSYNNMMENLALFNQKYVGRITVNTIGTSRLGRDIPVIILGKNQAKNKLLIMAGQHARERHGAWMLMRQIEHYCENWETYFDSENQLGDFFDDVCIHFIPMTNPDGHELSRIGLGAVPDTVPKALLDDCNVENREEYIEMIKTALEYKINYTLTQADFNPDWEYHGFLPSLSGEKLGINQSDRYVIKDGTEIVPYKFRESDMYMWKSNARGIDLHYNWWSDSYSTYYAELVDKNLDQAKEYKSSLGFTKGKFSTENELGIQGVCDEDKLILDWIMDNNLTEMIISIHGRGPTHFWNYKIPYYKLGRALHIVEAFAGDTNTPYSESNNARMGFVGYMEDWMEDLYERGSISKNQYIETYFETYECGWSTEKLLPNGYCDFSAARTVCPLPPNQTVPLWKNNQTFPLLLAFDYVQNHSYTTRYSYISKYQLLKPKQNFSGNPGEMQAPAMFSGTFRPVIGNLQDRLYAASGEECHGYFTIIGNRCFMDVWIKLKSLGNLWKTSESGDNIYSDETIQIIPSTSADFPKSKNKMCIWSAAIGYIAGKSKECSDVVTASIAPGSAAISLFCGASYLKVKHISHTFEIRLSLSYEID